MSLTLPRPRAVLAAVLAALAIAPATAGASLNVVRPNAWDPVTFYGHGGYSADGAGPNDVGAKLQAEVPADSTVVRAYLFQTYNRGLGTPDLPAGEREVTFDGNTFTMPQIAKLDIGSDTFFTARSEVTSIVAAKVGSGGGITDFPVSSTGTRNGLALVVIYANPSEPEVSIAVLNGVANPSGDTAKLTFVDPLDKTKPGFRARMSLGIAWSADGSQGDHTCGGMQYSSVQINTAPLAGCAGNADDSATDLITVGGVGDSLTNPTDPTASSAPGGNDDELYDLASFTAQNDAELNINTANPSNNDNIFLAVVEIAAKATAGTNGETPPPVPVAPTPTALTSSEAGTDQHTVTANIAGGATVALLDGSTEVTTLTVPNEGTYTVNPSTGVITFDPVPGFRGAATAISYKVTNSVGSGTSTYTPTVTLPAAPAPSARTSTGVGTAAQSVTLTRPTGGAFALVSGGTETNSVTVPGEGTYTLDPVTGELSFAPALGFSGAATAVTFRVKDAYGQHGDTTYTPTVTLPAHPAPGAKTSSGTGAVAQTATLDRPTGGSVRLLDGSTPVTSLTVPGEGTYALDPVTGVVTFTPALGFHGVATAVTYRATDAYGQSSTATYTSTVVVPSSPVPPARTSHGVGTAGQRVVIVKPAGGSVTLLDAHDQPTTTLTVAGQGTYTLDPATGELTFAPKLGFVGVATAARFRVTDAYGQSATATYTANVAKPAPPAAGAIDSVGKAGDAQSRSVAVPAGGKAMLLDAAGLETTVVVIEGVGTYAIEPETGALSFIPARGFTGTPPAVRYRVTDAYGQAEEGTYAAAVTPEPVTGDPVTPTPPTATPCASRRVMSINWKIARGVKLRAVTIKVNGKVAKRLGGGVRKVDVDLRGRAAGLVKVEIAGRTTTGRTYSSVRTYRPCVARIAIKKLPTLTLR